MLCYAVLCYVKVRVKLVEARFEIRYRLAEPAPPPYRIENQTSFVVACRQKDCEHVAKHEVQPMCAAAYAWAEDSKEHVLLLDVAYQITELVSRKSRPAEPTSVGRADTPAFRAAQLHPVVAEQPLKLDAMLQTMPVGGGGDKEKAVAWTRVELVDGVRVLTIAEQRSELLGRAVASAATDDEPHTFAGVELAGVGISVVHVGCEELAYISLADLRMDLVQSASTARIELTLGSLQVDNQQANATLPAVVSLAEAGEGDAKGKEREKEKEKEGEREREKETPVVHLSVVKLLSASGAAVDWWDFICVRLLELDVALEPQFVQALLDFVLASKVIGLAKLLIEQGQRAAPQLQRVNLPLARGHADLLRYGTAARMLYFHELEIHPVKFNITFVTGAVKADETALPIPHLNAAPICLASFVREHMFGTGQELGEYVGRHYIYSILRQVRRRAFPLLARRAPQPHPPTPPVLASCDRCTAWCCSSTCWATRLASCAASARA